MANPKNLQQLWKMMMFRYAPKKGQIRSDPTRPLSGRPLSTGERLLLENDLANTSDRYSMRGYDETEAGIEAARARRTQALEPRQEHQIGVPENMRDDPNNFLPVQDLGREEIDTGYGGSSLGFAGRSGSGELGDEFGGRFRKGNQGGRAAIDRRMGQIGDQLIDLEERRIWLKPDDYAQMKAELQNEYQTLNAQRVKLEEAERLRRTEERYTQRDETGDPYYDRDVEDEFIPGRAEQRSVIQGKLRELMGRAYLAQSRGSDEEFDALRAQAQQLQEELARVEQMPLGAPKVQPGEILGDTFRSMTDPQLMKGSGRPSQAGNTSWAQNYLRTMRFAPLDKPIEIPEQEREMPELMKQIMGLGGKALEIADFADPVSQGIGAAQFLGPAVTGQKPVHELIADPERTGRLRATREAQGQQIRERRSMRQMIEEQRRANAQLRP